MRLRPDQQHTIQRTKSGRNVCIKCLRPHPDLQTPCVKKIDEEPAGTGEE